MSKTMMNSNSLFALIALLCTGLAEATTYYTRYEYVPDSCTDVCFSSYYGYYCCESWAGDAWAVVLWIILCLLIVTSCLWCCFAAAADPIDEPSVRPVKVVEVIHMPTGGQRCATQPQSKTQASVTKAKTSPKLTAAKQPVKKATTTNNLYQATAPPQIIGQPVFVSQQPQQQPPVAAAPNASAAMAQQLSQPVGFIQAPPAVSAAPVAPVAPTRAQTPLYAQAPPAAVAPHVQGPFGPVAPQYTSAPIYSAYASADHQQQQQQQNAQATSYPVLRAPTNHGHGYV